MEQKETKRTIKVKDAVRVYNVVKAMKLTDVKKDDRIAVLKVTRALKAVAGPFDDFVRDAQERLRPEGFDEVLEKARRWDGLTPEEKEAVNAAITGYNKELEECVNPEGEKEVEIEGFEPLSDDTLAAIPSSNADIDADTLLLIQDTVGR